MPSLSIVANLEIASVRITPNATDIPIDYSLAKVTLLYNDITAASGFKEVVIPHLDDFEQQLTSYVVGSPYLMPGKTYALTLSQI